MGLQAILDTPEIDWRGLKIHLINLTLLDG